MQQQKSPSAAALRYTLQALAGHQYNRETAHELLSNVAQRLAIQTEVCDVMLSRLDGKANPEQERNLRHLRYLHFDTYRLTLQVARNRTIFERFSPADQFVVQKTFEQTRDRHACSLERWVDTVTRGDRRFESRVLNVLKRRLGVQLICQHGVMLGKGTPHGAVAVNCDLRECVEDAYSEARQVCEAHLQVSPDLHVTIESNLRAEMLVRFWLHHALVELLKNAMKSSVEQAKITGLAFPTPIHIEAKTDGPDIIIDIVDEGTGLPDSADEVERLFGIGHTTESKRWDRLDEQQSYAAVRSPLSSMGVGLPVSRLMMQHFGGNVELLPYQQPLLISGTVEESGAGSGCTARIRIPLDTTIPEPEIAIKRGKELYRDDDNVGDADTAASTCSSTSTGTNLAAANIG